VLPGRITLFSAVHSQPLGDRICLALALICAIGVAAPAWAEVDGGGGGDARSLLAAAEQLRFSEDWYPAIDDYLSAIAKNPSYGAAYSGLAECYYELGEYDEALSYVRKAAPFLKGDTGLANLEGFVRIGLGDLAGAHKAFDSVASALPNDLDARFGLSLLDLSSGRKTAARERLEESLRISPQNGRALLSLALIASDQGRKEDAQALVEKAVRYHGSEPKTQYVAASLAAARGDFGKAAFYARNALDLKPGYAEARLLLGSLMYSSKSYDQAIALMREAVSRDRKNGMAWYTLGMAQEGAGKRADAIYSLKTACSLRPDDEVARIALELVVSDSTNSEDPSREAYADYHVARGREFEDRSSYDQSIFEYRRALRIYPYSKKARLLYAGVLKARGFPGKYLAELQFLKGNGSADQAVLDSIESYDSLLVDAVGRNWGVDEEALPKRPYKIALMYMDTPGASIHAAGQDLVLRYIEDILASSSRAAVINVAPKVSSFTDAFRAAREAEADYFALVSIRETERDVEIDADLRVARTGSPAALFKAYRTGNDRLKNSALRTTELLVSALPPLGSLLKRSQDSVLVDLGKADGLAAGAKLLVVKKGAVQVKPEGMGVTYPQSSVLAEVTVTSVGEEASAGTLKSAGFFDTVNIGDQVFLAPATPAAATGAGTAGKNASTGIPASGASAAGGAVATAEPQKEWPGLFTAIRALR
jgi:tetratricopeptide (TPR) repeat protein